MTGDKTYFVVRLNREKSLKLYGSRDGVFDIFYDDDALKNYKMVEASSVHDSFPLYTTKFEDNFAYALEIPKSTKTNTSDLQYIYITPLSGRVDIVSPEMLRARVNALKSLIGASASHTNRTNGKIEFISHRYHSVLVGLPILSKDVSHQVLSDLI